MKRYLTFGGSSYYADGGWLDFKGCGDTIEEAASLATRMAEHDAIDWWHVVDSQSGKIVAGISGIYSGELPDPSPSV